MAKKIRAYIAIELNNGKSYKYVNVTVPTAAGISGQYYMYGDTRGDSFGSAYNGDTKGKIRYDFNQIRANFTAASTFKDYLKFPEKTGDTYLIIRRNPTQTTGFSINSQETLGDSLIIPYYRMLFPVGVINTISVVEERLGDWH